MRATGNESACPDVLKAALLLAMLLLLVFPAPAAPAPAKAPIRVIVATEPWDRLVYADADNVPRGDIVDFVRRMNQVQSTFHFDQVLYPRLRWNKIFADKQADVYPFRTVIWTEPELGLLPTRTRGGVFFTPCHSERSEEPADSRCHSSP